MDKVSDEPILATTDYITKVIKIASNEEVSKALTFVMAEYAEAIKKLADL